MSTQTWMSGGSGSGVYDPVTTTDNVNVVDHDESWLQFKGRGRTYNFGTYRKSGMKAVCDEIRNRSRPKCLLAVFITTVLLILLLLIIVIASSRDSQSLTSLDYEKWENKSTGVNFLPVGYQGTVYLPFSVSDGQEDSYLDYRKSLDVAVEVYRAKYIHNHTLPNKMCNASYAPADALCQQPLAVFGTSCVHMHGYGYPAGQPCILLSFNLPRNYTARGLVPKDGEVYTQAEKVLGNRFSSDHVGISCEPTTPEDKKYVGDTSALGPAIEYNPSTGFPSYFFRPRTLDEFIPPAVMVQFRSIRVSLKEPHDVRFTCTAWGKAFDTQDRPVNQNMFTTSFVFRMY